jgi:hypothetical protein
MTKFDKLYNSVINEALTDKKEQYPGQHMVDDALDKLTQVDLFSNFYDRQGNLELYQNPEQQGFEEAAHWVLGTAGALERDYGLDTVIIFLNKVRERLSPKMYERFLQTSYKNHKNHYFFTHILPKIKKKIK